MPKKKKGTATAATAAAEQEDQGREEATAAAAAAEEAEEERQAHADRAKSRLQPDTTALRMTESEKSRALGLLGDADSATGCLEVDAVARCLEQMRVTAADKSELIQASLDERGIEGPLVTVEEALAVVSDVFASPKFHGGDLRKAVGRGELAKVRALLSRGCDPNVGDAAGTMAAHGAAAFGQAAALALLREEWGPEEFDFDIPDKAGWTPLAVACSVGHTAIASCLLEWGADPRAPNAVGREPLHVAAGCDYPECIPLLVAAGANPDATDSAGWTALHVAAVHGAKRCVDALAAAGADASKGDNGGRTPSKIAHPDAVLALRKALRSDGK